MSKHISPVSHTSHASHASHASAAKKAEPAKAASTEHKAGAVQKDQAAAETKTPKDGPALSNEAKEIKSAEQAQKTADPNAVKDPDATKDPNAAKDPNATDPSKDPKDSKQEEIDSLKSLLEEMKKQMEEMGKNKDEEKKPEDLGGCCGKSHGSQEAGDKKGDEDPNSVLLQDVAAVQQAKTGGQAQQGAKGAHGKHAVGASGSKGDVGTATAKLQTDYQKFKEQGAQIRPEVEQQVQQALGAGGGQATGTNPLGQGQNAAGAPHQAQAVKK